MGWGQQEKDNARVTPKPPVAVLDLIPEERQHLLVLLSRLSPSQWLAATVCTGWTVKDLVAHLLGDDLNRLSAGRDGHGAAAFSAPPSWGDLVDLLNRHNEEWVDALRRLSPRVLVELLYWSGERVLAHFRSLDPLATGTPVSWAGPDPAPHWLDIAREYTERWTHQAQVRDAVGAPGLQDRWLFHPVLDTFVRALPHTYREVAAADGTHIRLVVTGQAGGAWSLVRRDGRWGLFAGVEARPESVVTMDQDLAWRLFTKGVDAAGARDRTIVEGDVRLGEVALGAVAIIA